MAKCTPLKVVNRIEKHYKNELNGISLNFSLYIDETSGLVTFLELLKRATVEVEADIKMVQAQRKAKTGK